MNVYFQFRSEGKFIIATCEFLSSSWGVERTFASFSHIHHHAADLSAGIKKEENYDRFSRGQSFHRFLLYIKKVKNLYAKIISSLYLFSPFTATCTKLILILSLSFFRRWCVAAFRALYFSIWFFEVFLFAFKVILWHWLAKPVNWFFYYFRGRLVTFCL